MYRTKRLKVYDRKCDLCGLHVVGVQEQVEELIERGGEVVEKYGYFKYFVAEKRDEVELRRTRTSHLKETLVTARRWFKEHKCEGGK